MANQLDRQPTQCIAAILHRQRLLPRPRQPHGLKGKDQLKAYFTKLLAKNPNWVWAAIEVIPTHKGFTLKWKAEIPLPAKTLTIFGLDIVELEDEKISRNEVFFDRLEWMQTLKG